MVWHIDNVLIRTQYNTQMRNSKKRLRNAVSYSVAMLNHGSLYINRIVIVKINPLVFTAQVRILSGAATRLCPSG